MHIVPFDTKEECLEWHRKEFPGCENDKQLIFVCNLHIRYPEWFEKVPYEKAFSERNVKDYQRQ